MKARNYLIAAGVISATLSGCTKDDNSYLMASETLLPVPLAANVSVTVQTLRQKPGETVQWNIGTITATQLQVTGVHYAGNMLHASEYDDKVRKSIDILTPSLFTLGTVAVPADLYDHLSLGIKLAPGGLTNSGSMDNSLFLSGTFHSVPPPDPTGPNTARNSFDPVPIQIIVNDVVVMNTLWLDQVRLAKSKYAATLTINVNRITSGINDEMLNDAERTDAVVYITKTSNPNLYGIILKNLENHLMEVHMHEVIVNTGSSNIATPIN